MQPQNGQCDLITNLVFLHRDDKHKTEKPYKLQYDPGENIPRWNCVNENQSDIRLHDIRGRETEFTLEKQGFAVYNLNSKLLPADYDDETKVKKVYYEELRALLKKRLGVSRVEILEYGVRKRHPEFPISTGDEYEYLQPTSVVHIGTTSCRRVSTFANLVDFTLEAAIASSKHVLHINPSDYRRMQCVKYASFDFRLVSLTNADKKQRVETPLWASL
jgi:hypothetical protein